MNIPVGTVCIILDVAVEFTEYKGTECTVVCEKYKVEGQKKEKYNIPCKIDGKVWRINYDLLKIKKFPPDVTSWLTEKMDKLLQPNNNIVLEDV